MPVSEPSSSSAFSRVVGGLAALAFVVVILVMIFGPKSPPPEPAPAPAEPPAESVEPPPAATVEPTPAPVTTLSGTVTYRQRIALPPEATVTVRIEDTTLADAPATTLAETSFAADGRQVPLPFALSFDPAAVVADRTYTARATITLDGELRWTTTTAYQVLTRGNPTEVDLVLDQVDAGPPAPPPATSARLRDTEWQLIELDGRPVPPPVEGGRTPTIVFATDGSAFSAQGQCNRHFGTYEADDAAGTLAIRTVGSTRMGCPDEVMKEEAGFLAAIGRVATFRIEGEMLTLEGGNAVTRFAAAFANK